MVKVDRDILFCGGMKLTAAYRNRYLHAGLFPGTGGGTINPGVPQVTLPKDTVITERVYIGSLEFEDSTLCRVKTPSGYWDAQGRYHLMVHDFQGNVAAVVRLDGQTATAVQTNAYYPYGTPMATSTGAIENRYRYGGKEWEATNGLNLYDFEARFHDPTFGFLSPDPLYGQADGAPHGIAPRVYCAANPLRFIDPSGMKVLYNDGERTIEALQRIQMKLAKELKKENNASKQLELNARVEEISKSITDVMTLENDSRTYVFCKPKSSDAHRVYKKDNIIFIEGTDLSLLVHELKHVNKMLRGDYDMHFNKNGVLVYPNDGETIGNAEVEAYKAQCAVDPNSCPKPITSVIGITIDIIGRITNQGHNFGYDAVRLYLQKKEEENTTNETNANTTDERN